MSPVLNRFVLIVDDQPVVADTLVLVLLQAGYVASACYDASEALSICRAIEPDVLLVDVVLGTTSGVDFAIAARTICPQSAAILMSGDNVAAEALDRVRDSGLKFPLLAKPIPPKDLIRFISAELARKDLSIGSTQNNAVLHSGCPLTNGSSP